MFQYFQSDLNKNYIASNILVDLQKIENQFAQDIGLPNANTEKKERQIVDEVNANNVETFTRCDMWLKTLKKQCEKANNMFQMDLISVDWRVNPLENGGGAMNEGLAVNSRSV